MINTKKHISEERQYRWKKYLCEPIAKYLKQGVLLYLQLSWDDNNEYITSTVLSKEICN